MLPIRFHFPITRAPHGGDHVFVANIRSGISRNPSNRPIVEQVRTFSLILAIGIVRIAVMAGLAGFDYKVLAANRISTLETEMNAAAASGYHFSQLVGGDTSFGGSEVVVAMVKPNGQSPEPPRAYHVVAAATTRDLQNKLEQAGEDGFAFKGTRRFHDGSGPESSVCIMERSGAVKIAYKILAKARTSTMQRELEAAGQDGFLLQGITLSRTLVGVSEVVAIPSK